MLPSPPFIPGPNEVLVLEVNATSAQTSVSFVPTPDFGGPACVPRDPASGFPLTPSATTTISADNTLLAGTTPSTTFAEDPSAFKAEWLAAPQIVLDAAAAQRAVANGVSHAEARAGASITLGEWRASRLSPASTPLRVGAAAAVVPTSFPGGVDGGAIAADAAVTDGSSSSGVAAAAGSPKLPSTLVIGGQTDSPTACAAPVIGADLTLQPCTVGDANVAWVLQPTKPGEIEGRRLFFCSIDVLCVRAAP